jgi:hypothetical protein
MTAARRALALLAVAAALLATPPGPAAAQPSAKWGPFRGRLVDQATGQGIPGAAVIAIWWKNEPNPIQMNRSFFDALEAVTDADGHFEIPRHPRPPFFDFQIFPAEISYFAPAYQPVREEVTPPGAREFVAPTTVLMKRIESLEELRRRSRARPSSVPTSKMRRLIQAVNVERGMLGMDPLPLVDPMEEKP